MYRTRAIINRSRLVTAPLTYQAKKQILFLFSYLRLVSLRKEQVMKTIRQALFMSIFFLISIDSSFASSEEEVYDPSQRLIIPSV